MTRLAVILLVGVVSGCASAEGVRSLAEEARVNRVRVGELTRATEELRRELVQIQARFEEVRGTLEAAAREGEARRRETLEALEALRAKVAVAERRVAETQTLTAVAQTRAATAESRVVAAETRVESLRGMLQDVEASIGGLADQVARLEALPSPPVVIAREPQPARPAPRSSVAALTAEALFRRALESFRNGELGQAILDFEDFLAKHPSHELAGHARYWIGEAYFTARDFQHAAVEYRKAVDLAPKSEKTPETLFKLGLAYRSLNRPDRAREVWTQLIRDFPQSDVAQKARGALRDGSVAPKP
ncbi:MAG: tol-pal system protein YbgF [Candidatus Rokuibacteriota bacterium]